jgi:hypothetical protein
MPVIMATESHLLERTTATAGAGAVMVPPGPAHQPRLRTGGGTVIALRQGRVIGPGRLHDRALLNGTRLVGADDPDGTSWWIPALAAWSDGESTDFPEHPRRIGLTTGADHATAIVQGLSDRLGWEAVAHLDEGRTLPELPIGTDLDPEHFALLDGRLGHDIPTVVVVGTEITCWGAATTWERALQRAIYGAGAVGAAPGELATLVAALADAELHPVTVDLGSPRLRAHGIVRCSVQLLATA